MTSEIKFPQPTVGQLAEPIDRYIGLNPYWWSILEGVIDDIANSELWENYTAEIDLAIHELMIPMEGSQMVGGKAYRSGALTMAYNTFTAVGLDASSYLTGVLLSGGNIVIAEAGYYSVKAVLAWNSGDNGVYRRSNIRVNSVIVAESFVTTPSNGYSNVTALPVIWEGELALNDTVGLAGAQASAGALGVRTGVASTWLALHKIG